MEVPCPPPPPGHSRARSASHLTLRPAQNESIQIQTNGGSDDDDKEEVMVLTRQQNNERFLRKTKAKLSQVAKLTEQVEDLKWQLFYGNSEKDKEVKQLKQALLLKEQEIEEMRALQLSLLSEASFSRHHFLPSSRSPSASSPSSSEGFSHSSEFSDFRSTFRLSSRNSFYVPPSKSEVTQLYGSIVQVLQHQSMLMRRLSGPLAVPSPRPNTQATERLDLIERDVNAQISAVLGDQVSSLAPTFAVNAAAATMSTQQSESILKLLQKVETLIAQQEAHAAEKEQKRLQKEHQRSVKDAGKVKPFNRKRALVLSLAAACGLYMLSISSQNHPRH